MRDIMEAAAQFLQAKFLQGVYPSRSVTLFLSCQFNGCNDLCGLDAKWLIKAILSHWRKSGFTCHVGDYRRYGTR
jgi:hypothetical protein